MTSGMFSAQQARAASTKRIIPVDRCTFIDAVVGRQVFFGVISAVTVYEEERRYFDSPKFAYVANLLAGGGRSRQAQMCWPRTFIDVRRVFLIVVAAVGGIYMANNVALHCETRP